MAREKFSLASLLNEQSRAVGGAKEGFAIRQVPIDRIMPSNINLYGIRGIEELAASIESMGLQQPLVVLEADKNGMHELVSGERRRPPIRR